jgi:hypothetical protein
MKALREAVEVSNRVRELNETEGLEAEAGAEPVEAEPQTDIAAEAAAIEEAAPQPSANGAANGRANGNGNAHLDPDTSWEPGLYEGKLRLEIGPLGDFSQLVGFEETVGRIGATDISVERFSEGRATFSMRLDQPVDLLRELESLSNLDFKVRHTAPDNVILDVDEDGPERHAA